MEYVRIHNLSQKTQKPRCPECSRRAFKCDVLSKTTNTFTTLWRSANCAKKMLDGCADSPSALNLYEPNLRFNLRLYIGRISLFFECDLCKILISDCQMEQMLNKVVDNLPK